MKKQVLKSFVINTLRRASYRWIPRNEAKKKSKIGRNQYVCNLCKKVFPNKSVKIDHFHPVVDPVVGFTNWDDYINRMFCNEDGYQVLCDVCHDDKTAKEREIRKINKKKKTK